MSGLLSPAGAPGQVMAQWSAGEFEAIICGALVSEEADVLARPHISARLGAVGRGECVDFLVTLARDWGAALVTGDRHLLALQGMPAVMAPARCLDLLDARPAPG